MSVSSKTAGEFRKNLETHLHTYSTKTGESIHRLRRKVAFDRLLARLVTQDPPFFFLKGGYAMELRVDRARATKDIDLSYVNRISNENEPISELILQELQELSRINLNDHFVYQIGQPTRSIDNAPYGGSQHKVMVIIDSRPFVDFHLDVGGDFLINEVEKKQGTNWLEFYGISAPIIHMISIEQQFAEKLHSYTLPRSQINTRTKDLIDLILLLEVSNRAPNDFKYSLQRVFRARNTHLPPETLPEPPKSWEKPFVVMATNCRISKNLNDGYIQVSKFYNMLQTIIV